MTKHPIEHILVGEPVTVRNLTVFPLGLSEVAGPDYVTSAVAIERHGLEVTEVSEAGSVPNLIVSNPSLLPVLFLDGEEVRGAKQNRIINTSILVPPCSRTVIPVSCTEQGRWRYTSKTFSSSKSVMALKARRSKMRSVSNSLDADEAFRSNQVEVWNNIKELHAAVGSQSETEAMADAYNSVRRDLDGALEQIPLRADQYGLLAMIDGQPAGWDLVSRTSAYADLHAQLLESYTIQALVQVRAAMQQRKWEEKEESASGPGPQAAMAFLEQCAAMPGKAYPSVGLGSDWRFTDHQVVGSGLECDGGWVHMAYFRDERDDKEAAYQPRHIQAMRMRAALRRNWREG